MRFCRAVLLRKVALFSLLAASSLLFFLHLAHRVASPYREAFVQLSPELNDLVFTNKIQDLPSQQALETHFPPEGLNAALEPKLNCKECFGTIFVMSKPQDAKVRSAIRQTWLPQALQLGIAVVFVIGMPSDESSIDNSALQRSIAEESSDCQDLLQFELRETYRNLTLKTYSFLHWAAKEELKGFVMKVDCDVVVQPRVLLQTVQRYLDRGTHFILGNCHSHVIPDRDPKHKWHVTCEEYSLGRYPRYCSGAAYVLSPGLHSCLVGAVAGRDWALPLEDVLFTGIAPDSPTTCAANHISHQLSRDEKLSRDQEQQSRDQEQQSRDQEQQSREQQQQSREQQQQSRDWAVVPVERIDLPAFKSWTFLNIPLAGVCRDSRVATIHVYGADNVREGWSLTRRRCSLLNYLWDMLY